MSENTANTAPGGQTTPQNTASQPKSLENQVGKQLGVKKPNPGSAKGGTPGAGQSADADGKPRNALEGGPESDRKTFDLPEEFDIDSADEETLKKLSKWKKKIKIDGKEMTVPFLDSYRYLQKELAADKRMNEGVKAKQEKEELLLQLKENPRAVLESLGHDVRELAKTTLLQQIEYDQMSESEKRALHAEQEMQKYKNQLLAQEQAKAQQEEAEYRIRSSENWQKQIVGALEKSGLPKDPLCLKLTAQFVLANRKAGYSDFSAEDAVPMVKDFCTQMARYYMKSVPMPDLFKALGDEWDSSVRKYLLDQAGNPIKEQFKQPPSGRKGEVPSGRNQEKFINADQWRENMEKRFS